MADEPGDAAPPGAGVLPGSWSAVAATGSWLLVDAAGDGLSVLAFAERMTAGLTRDGLLGALAGAGLLHAPSFALVLGGPHPLALARGRARITVTDGGGRDTTVTAPGAATWLEVPLPSTVRAVVLAGDSTAADLQVPAPVPTGEVVAAGALRVSWPQSLTPSAPGAGAGGPGEAGDTENAAGETVPRAPLPPASVPPPPPAVPPPPGWQPAAAPSRPGAGLPRDGAIDVVARRPTPEGVHTAVPPRPARPPRGLPDAMAGSAPPRPAHPAGAGRPDAALVPTVRCPSGHGNDPSATHCRRCGEPVAPQQAALAPRPPLGVVHLPTGESVPVDRGVLLGRSPGWPADPARRPHLVQLSSPQGEISRTHLEITAVGWEVLASDLGSTNGTTLTGLDGVTRWLVPEQPTALAHGDTLAVADDVILRFDAAGE